MPYKPKGEKGEGLREKGQDRGALKMVCVRIPATDEKLLQEYFDPCRLSLFLGRDEGDSPSIPAGPGGGMSVKGGGGDPQAQIAYQREMEKLRHHVTTTGRKAQTIRRWLNQGEMNPADFVYIIADWAMRVGWERQDPVNPNEQKDQVQALQARDWIALAAWLRYEVMPGIVMRQPTPLVWEHDEEGSQIVYAPPLIRDGFFKELTAEPGVEDGG